MFESLEARIPNKAFMTGLLASVALAGSAQKAEAMVVTPLQGNEDIQNIANISYLATPAQEVFVSKSICEVTGTPCAFPDRSQMYLGPAPDPLTTMHETGHIVDGTLNGDLKNESAPARLEFRAITGYNDGPWYDGNKDTKDVSEAWADLYGSCAWRGLRTVKNRMMNSGNYGFKISRERYNNACAFFGRVLANQRFLQPAVTPSRDIPFDRSSTESFTCGARDVQLKQCLPRIKCVGIRPKDEWYAYCRSEMRKRQRARRIAERNRK